MMNKKKKIIMIANTSWSFYNFRRGLIKKLLEKGHNIIILAPFDKTTNTLKEWGCECYDIQVSRKSKNPIIDAKLILFYRRFFKDHKPDIILSYTIKPNIYGAIAAGNRYKLIANITGLGVGFISQSFLIKSVILGLYRLALCYSDVVFFQNQDDYDMFVKKRMVSDRKADVIPGSGVDLQRFSMKTVTNDSTNMDPKKKTVFILVARMLWYKGIGEYAEAAKILLDKYKDHQLQFWLLGKVGDNNPEAIPKEYIDQWHKDNIIQYLGETDDVRGTIHKADCVVLPSCSEGTAKILLESAAMGKPIITTDAPGCGNVIDDGHTGFLCKPKNVPTLVAAIEKFISLSDDQRQTLGKNGRKKMEKEFDENIVIDKYMKEIQNVKSSKNC
jgi:glycosyltransferase involved in cell wall biosynthesis